MKKVFLILLVALLFSLFSTYFFDASKAQSSQETVSLFSLTGAEKSVRRDNIKTLASIAEVREQEININFGTIDFETAKKLSLPLLDGKTYLAVQRDSEGFVRLGANEFSWRGKITDDGSNGDVILTVKDRAMSGLIYTQAGVYEIIPQADFTHLLVQIDQSLFPACGGAIPPPEGQTMTVQSGAGADLSKLVVDNDAVAPDDGSLIDVLVVYTAQARIAQGGTTQIQTLIQNAVSATNAAYQNSDINPRLRLVGTMEVSYDEAAGTLDAGLNWVRTDSTVAAARNNVKADLVSLIVENGGGSCGLGYIQRTVGSSFAGSAFSAVARSCAVGNLSFAHELGHNQGCEHNPENSDMTPSGASYPYAFGHYVDGSFRTVMSYSDPCTLGCNRVAYFSNPSVNFNGVPTGISNQRDNHRVINNTALTVSLFRNSGDVTPTPTPTPTPVTVQLSQGSYGIGEAAGDRPIIVNRTSSTAAASVDYATSDTAGITACGQANTGVASSRCDYATTVGTLRFAAGEGSKTIFIPIVDDGYVEGAENFTIRLSNPMGMSLGTLSTATITIFDDDRTATNPLDTRFGASAVAFFIRQQYIDFLGREPDAGGFAGWQSILNNCAPGDTSCDRISVSSGFFRSPEFQDRGSFIFRFYAAALGRNPSYAEFMPDLAKVSGFLSAQQLEDNKVAFVQEFMTRPEYVNKYGSLSNNAFVDTLIQTAGMQSHPLRDAWVSLLNTQSATKAQVLRAFTESLEVYNKFYNQVFVVMQYFGYLRRDPDASYLQWIQTLNQTGDYRTMINGFMNSNEYVLRFGP
jgi:peptidyl-Asp metalloendopeptidase